MDHDRCLTRGNFSAKLNLGNSKQRTAEMQMIFLRNSSLNWSTRNKGLWVWYFKPHKAGEVMSSVQLNSQANRTNEI